MTSVSDGTDRPTDTIASVSPVAVLLQFVRGFFMGTADIVPGVSGGTVALILGIYHDLIANVRTGAGALRQLVTGHLGEGVERLKAIDWLFLIPLGSGVLAAFALLRHPMEDLLHDHAEGTAAVFCGLVLASCWLVYRTISSWNAKTIAAVIGVAIVAFVLLGYQAGAVSEPALPFFFVSGAIAICAMILPGISGSFILLMLGMYAAVLGGSIPELAVFGVGATIGLGAFSSVLSWLLAKHEQLVLASLLGLMIGSFRVLWPWPNGVGFISDEAEEVVKGTELAWPDAGQLAGGVALAAAALVGTMILVRVAESKPEA